MTRTQHNWIARIKDWAQRRSQRQPLSELNNHLLRDIGITRAQVVHEAYKSSSCTASGPIMAIFSTANQAVAAQRC